MIVCNGRILDGAITGAQRYALELTSRFNSEVDIVKPRSSLQGVKGHMWEQLILPHKVGKALLWSPSITGPLAVERQVVTIFDVVPFDHPEWLNRRFAAWYRFLTPRLVDAVRKILVISEFTKQRLVHHFDRAANKIEVIPLAADRRFRPVSVEASQAAASRLKIPTKKYVLSLASLEPRKNLPRLLKAWAAVLPELDSELTLVLAGGKGRTHVFDSINLDLPPRVHLTGRVDDDDVPALYSGAVASVYPTLYEGFGLPALEALACGTPLLTSNASSLPEVVGDAAIKVDTADIRQLVEGLRTLLNDERLRAELSRRGLEQAMKFDWDNTASRTMKVLRDADY